jgi:hypothetical protein
VLPTATEPKLTDAGAMEIVAAPGALGELGELGKVDAVLGVPAIPVQPEMDRIEKNRRTRAPTEIALMPIKCTRVAYLPAPPNFSFMFKLFISAIVVCGTWRDYCPNGHLKDRGGNLHLDTGVEGSGGPRVDYSARTAESDTAGSSPNLWNRR